MENEKRKGDTQINKMKERRKKDRRVKPPKQGLPSCYTRHIPDRRKNNISYECCIGEDISSDISTQDKPAKPINPPKN